MTAHSVYWDKWYADKTEHRALLRFGFTEYSARGTLMPLGKVSAGPRSATQNSHKMDLSLGIHQECSPLGRGLQI